jgi:hypothetical protein
MTDDARRLAQYISVRELAAIDPVRGEISVLLCVGRPYQLGADEWACPVALDGLYAHLRDQHGVDSFQALVLAVRLAKTLLSDFVEKGGRLVGSKPGSSLSVGDIFDGGAL